MQERAQMLMTKGMMVASILMGGGSPVILVMSWSMRIVSTFLMSFFLRFFSAMMPGCMGEFGYRIGCALATGAVVLAVHIYMRLAAMAMRKIAVVVVKGFTFP